MDSDTEQRIKELNNMIMKSAAASSQSRMLALQLVHSCIDYGYLYPREDYLKLKHADEQILEQLKWLNCRNELVSSDESDLCGICFMCLSEKERCETLIENTRLRKELENESILHKETLQALSSCHAEINRLRLGLWNIREYTRDVCDTSTDGSCSHNHSIVISDSNISLPIYISDVIELNLDNKANNPNNRKD